MNQSSYLATQLLYCTVQYSTQFVHFPRGYSILLLFISLTFRVYKIICHLRSHFDISLSLSLPYYSSTVHHHHHHHRRHRHIIVIISPRSRNSYFSYSSTFSANRLVTYFEQYRAVPPLDGSDKNPKTSPPVDLAVAQIIMADPD